VVGFGSNGVEISDSNTIHLVRNNRSYINRVSNYGCSQRE
jgi:hypothetical protein